MRSTNCEGVCREFSQINERNSISVILEEGTVRVLDVLAEMIDVLLGLSDYRMSKESLVQKLSKQDANSKMTMASVEQLENAELVRDYEETAREEQ